MLSAVLLCSTVATGCADIDPSDKESTVTEDMPEGSEALHALGLPLPEATLTTEAGVRVSDLDEWSVRVTFTADSGAVRAWSAEAFGNSDGMPVSQEGAAISQRVPAEDVTRGSRYFDGSNPQDPSATYTVVVSPDGTDVLVAAAKTSR